MAEINYRTRAKELAKDLGVRLAVVQKSKRSKWRADIDGDLGSRHDWRESEGDAWHIAWARLLVVARGRCAALVESREKTDRALWQMEHERDELEEAQARFHAANEGHIKAAESRAAVEAMATPDQHAALAALTRATR